MGIKEEKKPDMFWIVCLAIIATVIVANAIYNIIPMWNHAQEKVEYEQRQADIENSPEFKYRYEKAKREMEAEKLRNQ